MPAESPSPRPKILVAHPWMGRGGSESTAMWSLQALQDVGDVAFATASPLDFEVLNRIYGTRVSAEKITFLPAPRLPSVKTGTRLVHWQRARFDRFCEGIADRFDVCISAYNPIHFGRPGIQLIGDFSFCEKSRLLLYPNAENRLCHRQSLLRRLYLSVGDFLHGGKRPPLAERGDCAVANSFWTARQMDRVLGIRDSPVLYPPSPGPLEIAGVPAADDRRAPLGFVSLGRISPEKEIETTIAILDRVRAAGFPVTLDVIGGFGRDAYGQRIREMVNERRDWIHTPGFLEPRAKAEIFATRSFALHACRVESFGIAVAEMSAAGLIPMVPSEGGTREIVEQSELIFSGVDEGTEKIITLLSSPERHDDLRRQLREHSQQFRPEVFMSALVEIVEDFRGGAPGPTASSQENSHVAETFAKAH